MAVDVSKLRNWVEGYANGNIFRWSDSESEFAAECAAALPELLRVYEAGLGMNIESPKPQARMKHAIATFICRALRWISWKADALHIRVDRWGP